MVRPARAASVAERFTRSLLSKVDEIFEAMGAPLLAAFARSGDFLCPQSWPVIIPTDAVPADAPSCNEHQTAPAMIVDTPRGSDDGSPLALETKCPDMPYNSLPPEYHATTS